MLVAAAVAVGMPNCAGRTETPPRYRPDTFNAETDTVGISTDGLRVATFNVHRFFDTVCDSGHCEPGDYEELPTQTEFELRADEISTAIEGLDAHIVLLQELETDVCLNALQTRLSDRYSVAVLGEIGSTASVDVAVFAEGELVEVRTHRDTPIENPGGGTTTFAREFLEVHLLVQSTSDESQQAYLIVFSAHFRSKVDDDPDRRLAEAMAAQEIVLASAHEHPEALIILGGDLNDTPGSLAIQAIEGEGELLRVASELPDDDAATYFYSGEGMSIDHLFVAQTASGAYIEGSAMVFRDRAGAGYAGSDHGALRASFETEQ